MFVFGLFPSIKAEEGSFEDSFINSFGGSLGQFSAGVFSEILYSSLEISVGGWGSKNTFSIEDLFEKIEEAERKFWKNNVIKISSLKGLSLHSFGGMISLYSGFGLKVFHIGPYLSGGLGLSDSSVSLGMFLGGRFNNFLYRTGVGFRLVNCYANEINKGQEIDLVVRNYDVFVQLGYFFYKNFYFAVKLNYYFGSPDQENKSISDALQNSSLNSKISSSIRFKYFDSGFAVSLCLGYSSSVKETMIQTASNEARAKKLAELQAESDFIEMQKKKKSEDKKIKKLEAKLANAKSKKNN